MATVPRERLLGELLAGREYARLRRDPIYAAPERGGVPGQAVLLIPGFLTSDRSMAVMGAWLRRSGRRPSRARIGINIGCAEEQARRLERRLERIAGGSGGRVAIVGHSRGGHFARILAVRRPELVSGIVTLGAPPLDPLGVHALVALAPVAIAALGSAGVPRVFRASCFLGECCRRFRTELHGPFPEDVGFVAVFSKSDGVVDWRRLTERAATPVEVTASHLGLVVNPHAYRAVADALGAFGGDA